jgi:hypothetical protein
MSAYAISRGPRGPRRRRLTPGDLFRLAWCLLDLGFLTLSVAQVADFTWVYIPFLLGALGLDGVKLIKRRRRVPTLWIVLLMALGLVTVGLVATGWVR